ncbi:hypothetical protein SRHO_G00132270 [Serrasalmus rhombeus]
MKAGVSLQIEDAVARGQVLFSKKGERGPSMPPSLSRVDDYKAVKKAKASSDTEASNSTVAPSREEELSIGNGTEARVQDC